MNEATDKVNETFDEMKEDSEKGKLRNPEHYIDKIHSVVGYEIN